MAEFINELSRTFGEFLLLPGLTKRTNVPDNACLKTPLVKFKKGAEPPMSLDMPFVSAMMQSVSGEKLAIDLARQGGLAFIYCSQAIDKQAKMVQAVKAQKLRVGAAVNTRDFKERIPALVSAGVDVLCIDSSDGYSEWQKDVLDFVRKNYGESVKIGAGNVVSEDGFRFLADNGADFIKVGIGGGSICITREQKAIGLGQATAVKDVVAARERYFKEKGIYIPLCSDGGIVYDNHIIMALAFGADFVMMGRYFARFNQAPGKLVNRDGKQYKEYWGEGSNRAKNWQRYDSDDVKKQAFEEGVNALVPCAGDLEPYVQQTLYKIKSTMCNLGSTTLKEFKTNARIVPVSSVGILEGGAHDVLQVK